ncbi:MAG: 16S rRNA (guanine(966)-N(2))-methyltransferase RsmD [Oscillospiraceae bacterium]|nr:16S rRNA (guanine(966)-N(2))-methyltransferase RsmD [Oscillospiraceae bacterium]
MRVITGKARGVALKPPDGLLTRPTADRVKEALFSIIHFEIPGARVLDLFGGTGQLGIEALSRDAASAVFVDEREDSCKLIKENLKRTGLGQNARVVRADYLSFLNSCKEKFDIILLDPPYAEVFLENSLKRITEIDILQSGGIIVTERPLGKELPWEFSGYSRSKDYKYGKTLLTLYRKDK